MSQFHAFFAYTLVILFVLLVILEISNLINPKKINNVISTIIIITIPFFVVFSYFSGTYISEKVPFTLSAQWDKIREHQTYAKLLLFLLVPLGTFYFLGKENKIVYNIYHIIIILVLATFSYVMYLGTNLFNN